MLALKMHHDNIALLPNYDLISFNSMFCIVSFFYNCFVTTFCKDRNPPCKLTVDAKTIKLFFPIAFRCYQF